MKVGIILIITFILGACAIGKREVLYTEMSSPPKLRIIGNELLIKTENSKQNSALLIYKIEPTIDLSKKIIMLKGFQAAGKKLITEFRVPLKNIKDNNISEYKVYWVDPDNKRTELIIENNK